MVLNGYVFSWKDDHSILRQESKLPDNIVTSQIYRIKIEDHKLLIGLCRLRKKIQRTSSELTVLIF